MAGNEEPPNLVNFAKEPARNATETTFRSVNDPVDPDAPGAEHYIAKLRALDETLDGDELIEAQRDLVRTAVRTLRFMEAAKFLEFVYDNYNETIRRVALGAGLASVSLVASDHDRLTVVEWAMSLEQPDFRLAALREVGHLLSWSQQNAQLKIDIFLERLSPYDARELLFGYSWMRVMGLGYPAIEEYIHLLPDGSDFSGVSSLVNYLRNESDILATDQLIPDDSRHIAREVRGELLRRWTTDDPQAAAAHVIANQDRIALGQLDVIVGEWAMRERREAEKWIRSQADEVVRSQAAHGMASHLVQRQAPDRAWEWALEIVDPDMRARTLRQVHAAWITQDYDAAENARLSLDE